MLKTLYQKLGTNGCWPNPNGWKSGPQAVTAAPATGTTSTYRQPSTIITSTAAVTLSSTSASSGSNRGGQGGDPERLQGQTGNGGSTRSGRYRPPGYRPSPTRKTPARKTSTDSINSRYSGRRNLLLYRIPCFPNHEWDEKINFKMRKICTSRNLKLGRDHEL